MKNKITTVAPVTIEQAIKDGNTTVNQHIKGLLIQREVHACVSSMVEFIVAQSYEANDAPFTWDDVENLYSINKEEIIYNILKDWEDKQIDFKMYCNDEDTFNRRVLTGGDFEVFLNSLDEDELKELCEHFDYVCEEKQAEVFEWWLVDSMLFEDLKARGEVFIDSGGNKIWGRCTTGQAILLDGVITRIAAKMEILEGQKNSWSNR